MKAIMKNGEEIYLNEVSEYAEQHGRLDYASMVYRLTGGAIVSLNVSPWKLSEDWERIDASVFGYEEEHVEETDETDEEDDGDEEVFQWFVIEHDAARWFTKLTNESIYFSYDLNMYLLGVTHWGTSWDYVLTEWRVEGE